MSQFPPDDAPTEALDQRHPRVLAERFELRHQLGSGGMATVWAAFDRRLNRDVAVKLLRRDLTDEHAHRIEREARAAARIGDPRIVTVLDLDHDDDGTPFLVLEALDGRTLADELVAGPLPVDRALRLTDDLLGALDAAHRCGVLHRDVKPSNVLTVDDGYRITDFGIASVDDETATSGDLMGTLVYLAPERFDGAAATPQSDVFAAGAVIYEAFTGTQPFRTGDTAESLSRMRDGRFDPLPDHVPAPLAAAVTNALHPDPRRRPEDAGAFARLVHGSANEPTQPIATPAGTVALDQTRPVDALAQNGGPGRNDHTTPLPAASAAASTGGFATMVRRPQTMFIGLGLFLVVALVMIVGFSGGDGSAPVDADAPADAGSPVEQLDQQLDRIEEIGR